MVASPVSLDPLCTTSQRQRRCPGTNTSPFYHRHVLGVRLLRITAWTLLGFGTIWWLLLMFLVAGYGAAGAGWLFLGGIGVLSLPIGVVWLLRVPTATRSIGAGVATFGMGVALAIWSGLDDLVFGSQELGWVVIVIGFAGATLAATDRNAPNRAANG